MADPIDPITVAGCIACWDVDDVVDSSGALSLPDRSGNGNDLAQATAGARLAVVHGDADFNGHKSLQGATGDSLRRATLTGGTLAQPITKYAVIRAGSSVVGDQNYFSTGTTGGDRCDLAISGGRTYAYAGTQLYTSGGATVAANTKGIARAVYNAGSSLVEWSPVGSATVQGAGAAGAQSQVGVTLMAFGGPAVSPFLGKGAYFILYAGIVSDADDAGIKAFLLRRFVSFGLVGLDLTSGTPTLDPGTLGQSHNLTGLDLDSGVPTLDPGTLGQSHTLTGLDLTSGVPTLDAGTLGRVPASAPSISQWAKEGPVISSWTKEGPVISEWKVS